MTAIVSRSAARPCAPLRATPSRLIFFARPSDHAGERKRSSSAERSKGRCGSTSPPPPSTARIAVCCAPAAGAGRQLVKSSETISVIRLKPTRLPRKLGGSHQKFVDRARALATLANCPHHQRLAAPGIAGSEHFRRRRLIGLRISRDVAARIVFHAELVEHALMHRMHVAHREEHQIGFELELAAWPVVQLAFLPVDAAADTRLDLAATP